MTIPPGWTNDATFAVHSFLASMRYGELMSASRRIWHELPESGDRSAIALSQFAQVLYDTAAADKLAGHLVGVGLDDVDFVQLAGHWLDGMESFAVAKAAKG